MPWSIDNQPAPQAATPTSGVSGGARPELVSAIIKAESAGNPNAVSNKGAIGLMQIEPSVAHDYGVDPSQLTNPTVNHALGVRYFNDLLKKYNGDERQALIAYNQGPNRTGTVPSAEAYADNVLKMAGGGGATKLARDSGWVMDHEVGANPGGTPAQQGKVPEAHPFFTGTTGKIIGEVESGEGYLGKSSERLGSNLLGMAKDPIGTVAGFAEGTVPGVSGAVQAGTQGLQPAQKDAFLEDFRQEGRNKVFMARPDSIKAQLGWHFTPDEHKRIETYAQQQYAQHYGSYGTAGQALMGGIEGVPRDALGLAAAYETGGISKVLAPAGYVGAQIAQKDIKEGHAPTPEQTGDEATALLLGIPLGAMHGKAPEGPKGPTPKIGYNEGLGPETAADIAGNIGDAGITGAKVTVNGQTATSAPRNLKEAAAQGAQLRAETSRPAQASRGEQQTETPTQNKVTNQVLDKPALRVTLKDGRTFTVPGERGTTHAQLESTNEVRGLNKYARKVERGFLDTKGQFVLRKEARTEVNAALPTSTPKLPKTTEAGKGFGKPHSEDLSPKLAPPSSVPPSDRPIKGSYMTVEARDPRTGHVEGKRLVTPNRVGEVQASLEKAGYETKTRLPTKQDMREVARATGRKVVPSSFPRTELPPPPATETAPATPPTPEVTPETATTSADYRALARQAFGRKEYTAGKEYLAVADRMDKGQQMAPRHEAMVDEAFGQKLSDVPGFPTQAGTPSGEGLARGYAQTYGPRPGEPPSEVPPAQPEADPNAVLREAAETQPENRFAPPSDIPKVAPQGEPIPQARERTSANPPIKAGQLPKINYATLDLDEQLRYARERIAYFEGKGDLTSAHKWAVELEKKNRWIEQNLSGNKLSGAQKRSLAAGPLPNKTAHALEMEYNKQAALATKYERYPMNPKLALEAYKRMAELEEQIAKFKQPNSEQVRIEKQIEREGTFPQKAELITDKAAEAEAKARRVEPEVMGGPSRELEVAPRHVEGEVEEDIPRHTQLAREITGKLQPIIDRYDADLEQARLEIKNATKGERLTKDEMKRMIDWRRTHGGQMSQALAHDMLQASTRGMSRGAIEPSTENVPAVSEQVFGKAEPGTRAIKDARGGRVYTEGTAAFDRYNTLLQKNVGLSDNFHIGTLDKDGKFVKSELGWFHPPRGPAPGGATKPTIDPAISRQYDELEARAGNIAVQQDLKARIDSPRPTDTPEITAQLQQLLNKYKGGITGFSKGSIVLSQKLLDVAQDLQRFGQFMRYKLAPQAASTAAERGGQILRQEAGRAAQTELQFARVMNEGREAIASLPWDEQRAFIERHEAGKLQPHPALQAVSDAWRYFNNTMKQDVKDTAKVLGVPEKQIFDRFRENYFPRAFERERDGRAALIDWQSQKKLLGQKGFLRTRTQPTLTDAVDAAKAKGLKLVGDPIDLLEHQYHEWQKFHSGLRALGQMKNEGLRRAFNSPEDAPPGWVPEPTEVRDIISRGGKGEKIMRGKYYVPEPLAQLLKNHLDRGLWNHDLYRTIRTAANRMNQIQLGLSPFHATFTMLTSSMHSLEGGLDELMHGHPLKAAGQVAQALPGLGIAKYAFEGRNMINDLREFGTEGMTPGPERDMVQAYIDSNFRTDPTGDRELFSDSAIKSFQNAARQPGILNKVASAAKLPLALIEYAGKPLFTKLIPWVKAGAFKEMAARELGRLPDSATALDRLRVIHGVADSIENRFGMINYDNLFWDKHWQNTIHLLTRAPGWYLGDIREFSGGLSDLLHGNPSRRLRFAVAAPLTVAIYSSLYQYAHTGTVPQVGKSFGETWRNFMYPLNGNKLADGTPERIQWPSYIKDIESFARGMYEATAKGSLNELEHYVSGKANPLVALASGIATNADFKNEQIRNPKSSYLEQLADVAKYSGKQLTPIGLPKYGSIAQRREQLEQTQGGSKAGIDSFMGLNVAPQRENLTPFRAALQDEREKDLPRGPYTHEQIQKRNYRNILRAQVRRAQDPQQIRQIAQKYIQSGQLSVADVQKVISEGRTPLADALATAKLSTILENYSKADGSEKQKVLIEAVKKLDSGASKGTLTTEETRKYAKQIMSMRMEYERLRETRPDLLK